MNTLEIQMVKFLKELKENYGAIGVKAEFELEGTKIEDILRLKEICAVAGAKLTLKIGGCESIRDLLEARIIGVNCLVAPMIESAYSLRKYLNSVSKVFPKDELENLEIFCNIETISAIENLDEIFAIDEIEILDGVIVERVDLCRSLGLDHDSINDDSINELVLEILSKAKDKNLLCSIGGGVSADSLPFFRNIPENMLDRFETRKVYFDAPVSMKNHPEKAILWALAFELFWRKNKLNYYRGISLEDEERINLIEHRYLREIVTIS